MPFPCPVPVRACVSSMMVVAKPIVAAHDSPMPHATMLVAVTKHMRRQAGAISVSTITVDCGRAGAGAGGEAGYRLGGCAASCCARIHGCTLFQAPATQRAGRG